MRWSRNPSKESPCWTRSPASPFSLTDLAMDLCWSARLSCCWTRSTVDSLLFWRYVEVFFTIKHLVAGEDPKERSAHRTPQKVSPGLCDGSPQGAREGWTQMLNVDSLPCENEIEAFQKIFVYYIANFVLVEIVDRKISLLQVALRIDCFSTKTKHCSIETVNCCERNQWNSETSTKFFTFILKIQIFILHFRFHFRWIFKSRNARKKEISNPSRELTKSPHRIFVFEEL